MIISLRSTSQTHFEDGSKISLKMKDGKEYVAVLSQVVEQQSFTFSVKVPGAELVTRYSYITMFFLMQLHSQREYTRSVTVLTRLLYSHLLDKSVDGQQTTITHSCGFSGGFIKSFWGILFKVSLFNF